MNSTPLFLFALVALAVIATPGPTVLLALVNGSHYGVRRRCPACWLDRLCGGALLGLAGSLAFYRCAGNS